jgi:Uma2 family endonuclease
VGVEQRTLRVVNGGREMTAGVVRLGFGRRVKLMSEAAPPLTMDDDSYLALDRAAEVKHELWDGEVFAMTGASLAHNYIVANLIEALGARLRGSGCRSLPSDMRVRVPPSGRYVYPDVTIVCGPPQLDGERDILLNPRVIFEVLSPSTAEFDRGAKLLAYRSLVSLDAIVLVEQGEVRLECYSRQATGGWLLQDLCTGQALTLACLPSPLPLADIYRDVEFKPA